MERTREYYLAKHQFYSSVIADILRSIDGKSYGGAILQSFCCVDYMGMALAHPKEKNDSNDYKKYIEEYLFKVNHDYANKGEYLWAVRNSLVHTYGESQATIAQQIIPFFIYTEDVLDDHLTLDAKKRFNINIAKLISELIVSVEVFFENSSNEMISEWTNKSLRRTGLEYIIERKALNTNLNLETIHPFLKPLNNFSTKHEVENIAREIKILIDKAINGISQDEFFSKESQFLNNL